MMISICKVPVGGINPPSLEHFPRKAFLTRFFFKKRVNIKSFLIGKGLGTINLSCQVPKFWEIFMENHRESFCELLCSVVVAFLLGKNWVP